MRSATRVLALTAIGAAAFVPAAHAQDMSTYSFAGTTLYIGGGFQYLTLPDIKFTGQGNVNNRLNNRFPPSEKQRFQRIWRSRRRWHRDGARVLGRLSRHRRRQGLLGQCRQQRPPDLPQG